MNPNHILLVDDDILGSQALKDHFEAQGYRVTMADGCREALEVLRGSAKVDLMILDYLMPDGRGTDLLHSMAEEKTLQRPPVVISSSFIDAGSPSWEAVRKRLPAVSQSLIQAYVNKPYPFENMDTVVSLIFGASEEPSHPNEMRSGDFKPPRRSVLRKSKADQPSETRSK